MDKTRPFRPPEKKPSGGVRLWQLVLCLVFFVAALFLRAFTPVRADFLVTGASSLRELAEQAGQALARSELVRVFAGSFGRHRLRRILRCRPIGDAADNCRSLPACRPLIRIPDRRGSARAPPIR